MKKKLIFKNYNLKSLLIVCSFFFYSSYAMVNNSQAFNNCFYENNQPKTNVYLLKENYNDSWILDKTINNVDFYHKIVTCEDKKAVLLKFDNKNSFSVKISWKQIVNSKQEPNATDEFSSLNTLIVNSGSVEATDCSDNNNDLLVVLPSEASPMYMADILSFSFSNIVVKEIN